jgi:tRNA-2-methylthio-N6-dimethylallyladenosine synthase
MAAMAETPAVCEQLHLPLQSGSDRVLSSMRRGYTAERYLERLAAVRAAVPDLAVSTDIIVGFPGETDEDFAATLDVVAEARYDSAYTFIFSPRQGTRAALMEAQFVPSDVIKERFERLQVVVERSALSRYEARVGRTESVLVEGPSRKDRSVLAGRTRQGKIAHFVPAPGQPAPAMGSLAAVVITGAAPHHLRAELVEVTAGPRHHSRIPVSIR